MPVFKVMTWNVENLFRLAPGAGQPDQQRFQQKVQLLANVINELAADVVALQEIGGLEPLDDLQQALGAVYPHRVRISPSVYNDETDVDALLNCLSS